MPASDTEKGIEESKAGKTENCSGEQQVLLQNLVHILQETKSS